MRIAPFCVAVAVTAALLLAQQPTPQPAPQPAPSPTTAAAELPAAGSPAAAELLARALDKMLKYERGAFTTTESRDLAMLRNLNLGGGGPDDILVDGGWQPGVVWGRSDGSSFVRSNGRMVAKIGNGWRLRASKLDGGTPAPFTVDPDVLFTVLKDLPEAARKVEHVEAGEVGGQKVAILSLVMDGETASDFADSGAVPGSGGSPMMLLPGMGGMAPEPTHTVHVALFVHVESADLLRASVRVYEQNPMMGNIRVQVQGGGDAEDADEDEKEPKDAAAAGAVTWKKGFPDKKPAKDESVTTYRVDFKQLGTAEPPVLDDRAKALLRLK